MLLASREHTYQEGIGCLENYLEVIICFKAIKTMCLNLGILFGQKIWEFMGESNLFFLSTSRCESINDLTNEPEFS